MNNIDDDTRLFQNSIKYLHNITTLRETNVPALKSFLCLKRRLMELRKNTFLPKSATKPSLHCQRCFLNLFDGPTSYNISSKSTKHKFADKVLAKEKAGLRLTKYQRKYLKNMNKFTGNQLVTKCGFCKHKMFTNLEKPRRKRQPKETIQPESVTKKKKKKKKDKLCGLSQDSVSFLSLYPKKKRKSAYSYNNQNISGVQYNSNNNNNNTPVSKNNSRNVHSTPLTQQMPNSKNEPEVICLDSDDSIQEVPVKRKIKMKPVPIQTSTPVSTPLKRNKIKNSNKLSEIFKNSTKKNKSSSLMDFLQSL